MTTFVNLLPWTCRKAQLIRLRLVQWSVAWAAVGGLMFVACVVRWDQWNASRDRVEWLQQAYAPTNAVLAEIKTLGRGVEQLRAQETVVAQLESPRPALTLLGLVSRSARECEGRLRIEQLSVASSQLSDGSRHDHPADGARTANCDLLQLAAEVTDANAAFFDVAHGFAGCIAGLHEVLRRQGLLEGTWCLDPNETLSPGQSEEIDRVYRMYPHLNDDEFVAAHRDEWLG